MRKGVVLYLVLFVISFSYLSCTGDEDRCEPSPSLETLSATEITDTSARLTGTIVSPTCDPSVTSQGFVFATSTLPKIEDNVVEVSGKNITRTIIGLEQNTIYFFRTFFTNPTGTYYGSEKSFSTFIGDVKISTRDIDDISANAAKSGGIILSDGGSHIQIKGVAWSTFQNPTTLDNNTDDGEGLDAFISELTDLEQNTTYFLRSYASNEAGTFYGEELEFKTSCANDTDKDGICDEDDDDDDNDGFTDGNDCDPLNADINPNALEVCDGFDNDCNGIIDDGFGIECQLQVALDNGQTPCDLYAQDNSIRESLHGLKYMDGIIYNFNPSTCETSVFSECIETYTYFEFNLPTTSPIQNSPYNQCGADWTPGTINEMSLICLNVYADNKYDFGLLGEYFVVWVTDNYNSSDPEAINSVDFVKDGFPNASSELCEPNYNPNAQFGGSTYGFLFKKYNP